MNDRLKRTENTKESSTGITVAAAIAAFLCPLGIYAATACRTVYWGDTGEFLVAALRLGIPHSPGTPLYPLLGRCFSIASFGNPTFAVNFLSGFFAALSSMFSFLTVSLIARARFSCSQYGSIVSGLIAALVWSFTHSLWSYSVIAEVYTLQMAFFMGLVYLGVRIRLAPSIDSGSLLLFFFLCGLSLTSAITMALLLPVFLVLVLPAFTKISRARKAAALALFVFGLTPYLYMPIRSAHNPAIDWGNPETLSQFLWVLTAREFAGKMLGLKYAVGGGPMTAALTYWKILVADLTYTGVALSIIGMVVSLRFCRYLFFTWILFFGVNLAYSFTFGADLELEAYLLASLAILVLCLGIATAWFSNLGGKVFRMIIPIFILALPMVMLASRYSERNLKENDYAERVGMNLLSSMEESALYFTDNTVDLFTVLYIQVMENHRPDVHLIYLPYLDYEWYRSEMAHDLSILVPEERDAWLQLMKKRASYYTPLNKALLPSEYLLPDGIRFRIGTDSLTEKTIERSLLKLAVDGFDFGTNDYDTRRHYAIIHSYLGEYFFQRKRPDVSVGQYTTASLIMPENCEVRLNLARAQEEAGLLEEAAFTYRECLKICRDTGKAFKGLGRIALSKRDFQSARDYLLAAASADRTDPAVYYNLGLAQLGLGDLEGALHANAKAVELKPEFPEALTNLGICYLRMGRHGEAVLQFRRAIAADSSYVQAYLNLAEFYLSQDNTHEAREILRIGLRMSEQDADYHLLRHMLMLLSKVSK